MKKKSILCGTNNPNLLKNETLKDFFENTVSQFSQKIAIKFNDVEISYNELDNWSSALATN